MHAQEAKAQGGRVSDVTKGEVARLAGENKRLERQQAALAAAFRKQLKLIDVLRRQKVHLEASRALAFTEDEFMRTLDLGAGA